MADTNVEPLKLTVRDERHELLVVDELGLVLVHPEGRCLLVVVPPDGVLGGVLVVVRL